MIRVIIIAVGFLLMVGGILGGLYYWGGDPLAKLGPLVGLGPGGSDARLPLMPAQPSYVDFGLLAVPVVQDREVKKQAELILRLEVLDTKKVIVAGNLPRLQHAFLQDMLSFLPGHLRDSNSIDAAAVRSRLLVTANKVMGENLVRDVIIEHASVK